jgi:hypothetical protein
MAMNPREKYGLIRDKSFMASSLQELEKGWFVCRLNIPLTGFYHAEFWQEMVPT